MDEVIEEGDESRQGTDRCPNCGRTIMRHFPYLGDPPKCSKCGSYYKPIYKKHFFEG